ncbi:hypothetical protein Q4610_18850 [Sphingobium sp. HBC34]|uniref:ATP-binding protein n=1 Tax=Sphingobium cyanobacteriorum TaxID=3063954 RepID=A0ABT8ZRD4_9SPHN|nr:hypothetical protein [Sphingobium sp. HBC34]MDO7837107.1 hypothetical protein [Sphingobium sp. HBC34]
MASIQADFAVADDILLEAASKRLTGRDSVSIERSGRIGPLVEIAMASVQFEQQYRRVAVNSKFSADLTEAMRTGKPFGNGFKDCAGAFPLGSNNPIIVTAAIWDQWTVHAENIAKAKGLNPQLIAALMGAMVEIQDNVYEHSGAPQTGVVAYAVTPGSFEFVVADRGIGVLQTLRQNPAYADIPDAGAALQEMVKDGVSRFPAETGHGKGFNQLFRALVGQNAELRFRSGDHALTMRPTADPLRGESVLAQVASLNGLAISVFCRSQTAN